MPLGSIPISVKTKKIGKNPIFLLVPAVGSSRALLHEGQAPRVLPEAWGNFSPIPP